MQSRSRRRSRQAPLGDGPWPCPEVIGTSRVPIVLVVRIRGSERATVPLQLANGGFCERQTGMPNSAIRAFIGIVGLVKMCA